MIESSWLRLEVDSQALAANISVFRRILPKTVRLLAVVKADGYGHGLLIAARAFLAGGADVLGVHTITEALRLREAGINAPILVLGPLHRDDALLASSLDLDVTIVSLEAARNLAAGIGDAHLRVHLKVDTGVHRQGVAEMEILEAIGLIGDSPGLELVGLSSHFANIEDTTDHTWADRQISRFKAAAAVVSTAGFSGICRHMSCSAASLLWQQTELEMARVGISAYGLWPSRETLVAARSAGGLLPELKPAMRWICGISQIRDVAIGQTVGYGLTWKAPIDSRIAVLPVGYADGYPRALSDRAHVLIGGQRAPLRGRICMNLCMADITHIPGVRSGDPAVLLGGQGDETISAEDLAAWLGTIPYEILVLPGSSWQRVPV